MRSKSQGRLSLFSEKILSLSSEILSEKFRRTDQPTAVVDHHVAGGRVRPNAGRRARAGPRRPPAAAAAAAARRRCVEASLAQVERRDHNLGRPDPDRPAARRRGRGRGRGLPPRRRLFGRLAREPAVLQGKGRCFRAAFLGDERRCSRSKREPPALSLRPPVPRPQSWPPPVRLSRLLGVGRRAGSR